MDDHPNVCNETVYQWIEQWAILVHRFACCWMYKQDLVISASKHNCDFKERFFERDGVFFLTDRMAEYSYMKMTTCELKQMPLLAAGEPSAIQWILNLIKKEKPQTFSYARQQFQKQCDGWSKNEKQLDLMNQKFLSCFEGKRSIPAQIVLWMMICSTLRGLIHSEVRNVRLASSQPKKKLKVFRMESVGVGFKKDWPGREYSEIIDVADKTPNDVQEKDPKLLMWYDQTVTRMGS